MTSHQHSDDMTSSMTSETMTSVLHGDPEAALSRDSCSREEESRKETIRMAPKAHEEEPTEGNSASPPSRHKTNSASQPQSSSLPPVSTLSSCLLYLPPRIMLLLLMMMMVLLTLTAVGVGVSLLGAQSSASETKREARAFSYQGDMSVPLSQDTPSSLSLVSRLHLMGKGSRCYGNETECQRQALCDDDELLCRCPQGYYLHRQRHQHHHCRECKKPCPKGYYLLSSCSDYSEPVCIPCSRCTRTQYIAAACTSTSDTLCVDVTFPLRLLPTNGTNCSDEKEPISLSHSSNVFLERLVSMKELETPMYVTNNQQTQDFVWHRDSGIDIVVGISGVYLIPEYRELDVEDDSQFFLTQSMETQRRLRLFAHTRKQYCRHPVPDYYYLHLEVIKNRTTTAQVMRCDSQDPTVPRCPKGYKDGDRYLKWDINKRCFKYSTGGQGGSSSQPLEVLRDGFNTVVCTEETSLDRQVFGVWRPVTLEMMLPSTDCAMARQQCDFCLSLSACHGLDKHKSCCGISCYNKDSCHKLYSDTCPPPEVECATGEVHRFTVIPVFSSMSEEWHCHLTYQQPAYLYNISYTVSIPDLGLQLPTQTYTAGLEGLDDHRRRADQFHFIRVWHDTRMPVDREVILRGNHMELGATNPNHMQPFLLHALKAPSEFSRGGPQGFLTRRKGASAYSTAVQFERPFLYSSTTWYKDGCLKNVSRIFPNQTLYREEEEGVRVMAKKVDTRGSFWYQMSHQEKSPYIKLSVPEGESILQWFMGRTVEGTVDGDTLSGHLSWDDVHSLWTIHITGKVKDCPAIFTLQIFNKMASSCAAIYDVVVACPNNFTLTVNLSRTVDDYLPDIFVLVLKDASASHQMVLSSVVSPVTLPVSSSYTGRSAVRRGDAGWPEWSPVLGVGVVYLTGLGLLLGLYIHMKCSADKIHTGHGGPQSQQPAERNVQDYRHADGDLHNYRHADGDLHDYRHAEENLRNYQHTDADVNDPQHAEVILCDHQYLENRFLDGHQGTEGSLVSEQLPETGLYDLQHTETCPQNYQPFLQHTETCPQNYQQFEMHPLKTSEEDTVPPHQYHAEVSPQHQNTNPPNPKQDDINQDVQQNPQKDSLNADSKRFTRKCLCLFVQLYIVYSLVFTFSVPLSILYFTHHAVIGRRSEAGNFSSVLQSELNASFHKVQQHEREEELRLYESVESRLQSCAYHLQEQNRQFLQTYQDHLSELLSHVYLQDGAVDSLAGMSIMQNSSLYAEEIHKFLLDCNRTVQTILDRFDAFFLLNVKDVSRNSWLDFAREIFLTQEGDAANRKYMSQDQLTRFLHWLRVDKIHELFSVSQVVSEGLAKLKLPSPSEHLKQTVTSPFEALDTSLPAEPMVAAHTFLVLHPPPTSSPTPLSSSLTSTGSLSPHPEAALLYSDGPSGRMEFYSDDIDQGINGSRSQYFVGEEGSSTRSEEVEDDEGVWVYVMIALCLMADVLLFIFRMSWMVRQLKAARDGYEEKIPTDPVCQKLLAVQTGHPVSRMQVLYQAHSYLRQNKENLTSEKQASGNNLNMYLGQSSPRPKDDILLQIMQQKINGGKIGQGQGGGGHAVRDPTSPQPVATPSSEMGSMGCWLQRLLVSQLLWRFVVTCVLVVLVCVVMYTADWWLTADNLRVLVGGQSVLRDLHLQVYMTNHHLAELASHLTTILREHTHTVRAEVSAATQLFSSTLNMQRDLLIKLLEHLCSGTATPMCKTLSNFSDLPLPQLPVWQPCAFLPPLPSLYHDVQGEHLDQLVGQQLSPLLQTARHWLSSMGSIVIAVLCLLFLCHAAATIARSYLLLWGHVARVPVFQISENCSVMLDVGPECRKPMQRSASWLESCESGVYVGENEADSSHPNRDV